jgi:hypothetical protein
MPFVSATGRTTDGTTALQTGKKEGGLVSIGPRPVRRHDVERLATR